MRAATDNEPTRSFDNGAAPAYNDRWVKVAAMKDALHLCMRFVLSNLPTDARVLCVGVGTGAELLYLAEAYPQWRFTAVEPSAKMLEICRSSAAEQNVGSRCEFHEGTLDTLGDSEPYDAATAILVSHYLGDHAARQEFFDKVGSRLRPGGVFVNADLAAEVNSQAFTELFEAWQSMLSFSGMSPEEVERYSSKFSNGGTALPAREIEAMLTASGFRTPVPFCQTLLIHAWLSRRSG